MSGNHSDDSAGPAIPRGVLRSRGGWKGDDLELEHHREMMQRQDDQPSTASATAVDLRQFRNEIVGEGYQAKHVVRQRTGQVEETKIRDMSRETEDDKKRQRKKSKHKHSSTPKVDKKKKDPAERLQKYLACSGMRDFRKEMQKMG